MTTRVRRRLADSETIRLAHAGRRAHMPILVRGVSPGRLTTFKAEDLKRLNVDERYQRVRITHEVNALVHVIRSGGSMIDPISVAERPDGSLWILDGQQRFWAADECQAPLPAMVFAVRDFEAEQAAFIALNTSRALSADNKVKSWPGEAGAVLRDWNEKPGSPFHGKIDFGQNRGRPYGAAPLARALAALLLPGTMVWHGRIDEVLPRLDSVFHDSKRGNVYEMVDAFMRLLPMVFPDGERMLMLPGVALARVAQKRWAAGVKGAFPEPGAVNKLRRTNWHAAVPSSAYKFLPIIETMVEQRWRA